MKHDAYLAELTGIILGDGSFYIKKEKSCYQLDISCNSKESHYIYISNLLNKLSVFKFYIMKHRLYNCVHIRIGNKSDVLKLLENTIYKAGNKIENKVTIPCWIWNKDEYLKACIRGLMDTDGSIYRLKPHWPNLFQLSFRNCNERLLKDVRKAFIKLGYTPSKTFDNKIVLTRKNEILRYFKEVGTNNPKEDSPVV